MHIDDTISEFIGALANMAMKNQSVPFQRNELLDILKSAKIETPDGDDYSRANGLIKKAIAYWRDKDRPTVVENINHIFNL